MFGFVVASLGTVSDEEKARYQALYCGLCRTLRDRYGQVSRLTLTYDLTFYLMLCDSLHEPPEDKGTLRCIAHPTQVRSFARSRFADYAADLTVALAYHKCLDDWHDDHALRAKAGERALAGAYARARERIPEQCAAIERSLAAISAIEADPDSSPDAAAIEFGTLLGQLFAHDQGIWADQMEKLGRQLGQFVYLMDAAVDYAADEKSGSYNPLVRLGSTPENMRTLLAVLIGNAADTFERLPLEKDLHLMRSVLYSGVWQQFNRTYPPADERATIAGGPSPDAPAAP